MAKEFFKNLPAQETPMNAKRWNGILNGEESMGSIVVEDITCKNILDTSKIKGGSGITAVKNSDGTWTFNGTPTVGYINFLNIDSDILEDGETYTFSSTNYTNQIALTVRRINISTGATTYYATQTKAFTLTIDKTTYTYDVFIQSSTIANTGTLSNLQIGWQIEKGSVDTGYVLHKEFENKEVYSTNEQVIGTWIDGKLLYRKVINVGTLPNATSKTIAHNISSVNMIRSNGSFGISTSGYSVPIPKASASSTTTGQISIDVDRTNIYLTTNSDRSDLTGYIILEYTKTTTSTTSLEETE